MAKSLWSRLRDPGATYVMLLLFGILDAVSCLDLNDVFTVQTGTVNGGCDAYYDVASPDGTLLDNWQTECTSSIDLAQVAIDNYLDQTPQAQSVRNAMQVYFGIPNALPPGMTQEAWQAQRDAINTNLGLVSEFFNRGPTYQSFLTPANTFLFCDSDFAVQRAATAVAQDYLGQDIIDSNGNDVPINGIPSYATQLAIPGNLAYWAGMWTSIYGYFFDTQGESYCSRSTTNLGLTSELSRLTPSAVGGAPVASTVKTVILCGNAFTDPSHEATYLAANTKVQPGSPLSDALPRSSTLLHEAFHAIFGDDATGGFLAEMIPEDLPNVVQFRPQETYDLTMCMDWAMSNSTSRIWAQSNPECYVFFVAHMYHLFGDPDGTEPWAINTNYDWQLIPTGQMLGRYQITNYQAVLAP